MDRKPDRLAYASKADAHQIDDWPEAQSRKSEDVLVRYKDTRGSMTLHLLNPPVANQLTLTTECNKRPFP
jgi:hypothetical protein